MATYKEIKGVTVQTRAQDPSLFVGTWASGGALGTARYGQGQFGPQTAAVAASGSTAPATANVESYDGSSWTEVSEMAVSRADVNATGTTSSGLVFGGEANPPTSIT